MKKEAINNITIIAQTNGSDLNKAIKEQVEMLHDSLNSIVMSSISHNDIQVPILIVKRQSNYRDKENHYEVSFLFTCGSGVFGTVYKSDLMIKANSIGYIYKITPSRKVIKLIKKEISLESQAQLSEETNVIRKLYPNMNKQAEIRQGRGHLVEFNNNLELYYGAIVMPFIPGIELFHYINDNWDNLNYKIRVIIAANVVGAVNDFHKKTGMVHNDLKPENMLIDPKTLAVTIVDFGFAAKIGVGIEKANGTPNGTPNYMAPEKLSNESKSFHNIKSDYFSLAGILGFILGSVQATERVSDEKYKKHGSRAIAYSKYNFSDMCSDGYANVCYKETLLIRHILNALGAFSPIDRVDNLDGIQNGLSNLAQENYQYYYDMLGVDEIDFSEFIDDYLSESSGCEHSYSQSNGSFSSSDLCDAMSFFHSIPTPEERKQAIGQDNAGLIKECGEPGQRIINQPDVVAEDEFSDISEKSPRAVSI